MEFASGFSRRRWSRAPGASRARPAGRRCWCARKLTSRRTGRSARAHRPSAESCARGARPVASAHFFTSNENSSNCQMPAQDFTPATSLGQVAGGGASSRARRERPHGARGPLARRDPSAPRRRSRPSVPRCARSRAGDAPRARRSEPSRRESAACATTRPRIASSSMLSLADLVLVGRARGPKATERERLDQRESLTDQVILWAEISTPKVISNFSPDEWFALVVVHDHHFREE